ncbi:MAG TPA: hypothetical protein VFY87_16235, partial [Geminicoccaceae bacterium]|nr:hypothetical protein [Geminicoccaceae bacterium]
DEAGAQATMAPIWQANFRFHSAILGLSPRDDVRRELKARAVALTADVGQLRMLLLIQKAPSIAKPLLIAVSCWLAVIFLSFGLLAPSNATTTVALLAAAAAVASSVLLIMELDRLLGGLIRVSIQPMVDALNLSIDPDVPNTAAGS